MASCDGYWRAMSVFWSPCTVKNFADVEFETSDPLVIMNFRDSYSCAIGLFCFVRMIDGNIYIYIYLYIYIYIYIYICVPN